VQKFYYIKRFQAEAGEKPVRFFDEHPKSRLILLSEQDYPRLEIKFGGKHKKREPETIEVADFIAVKGVKAKGKRLSSYEIASVTELEPVRFQELMPSPQEPEIPVAAKQDVPDEKVHREEDPRLPEGGITGEQMSLF
jgi:topoisomerase-4 subunit A